MVWQILFVANIVWQCTYHYRIVSAVQFKILLGMFLEILKHPSIIGICCRDSCMIQEYGDRLTPYLTSLHYTGIPIGRTSQLLYICVPQGHDGVRYDSIFLLYGISFSIPVLDLCLLVRVSVLYSCYRLKYIFLTIK